MTEQLKSSNITLTEKDNVVLGVKKVLDKSFEIEQGCFLYTPGGEVLVLLGVDSLYTGIKNIKEFLSKTNYLNEKSAAKILNRQKFICLYVCSLEMLDEKPFPLKSMYSYLEEVLSYRLNHNLVKISRVDYSDLFNYNWYKTLGVKCQTEPLNMWLLKYNLVSQEKLNIETDVHFIEKMISCHVNSQLLNAVSYMGNFTPVDIADVKVNELYFTINESCTKIVVFRYLGDKWLYLGEIIVSMSGLEKVSRDFLDDDAHMKNGTIRKELNLKNLGLYQNNELAK